MSNTTPFIQNLFTSRDNNANSATYVGQEGRLWYDSVAGLRVSNGNTPGGTPAVVAVSSANIGNLTIADTTISTIQANANINLVTNGTGNINVKGAFVTANTAGSTIIETLQNGTINFYVPNISYDSAVDIIGTADGTQLYPQNQGVLLHLTGQDSLPARIYSDGVNNYAAFIGRRYNGNATAPTQVLAGQTISRHGGTPYTNAGWPSISTARVDFVALEDQTATNHGTSIEFFTTPVGSANAVASMTVASTGITNAANVIPISDQAYSLGSSTLRWENVYAGQGGLWLADSTTNVETQLSVNNGTFYINGVQSIALGNLVIANTTLETITPNTNIYIGNVADTGYLQIDRTTQIVTQNLGNSAALLINGSLSNITPTEYTNTLFHTINVPGYDSVTLYDNFSGNTNTFSGVQGRAARGTIQAPTNTQADDVLFRLSGAGYGNGFDTALGTQGGSRIDFRATENFSATAKGSDIHFWTTQPGTTSTVNSGSIDWQGFTGNAFTFTTDNSVQTTAGIPLTQKANALGVATLDSNGYLTAAEIPPSLLGGVQYIGSWNAANNTPTLVNGVGTQGYEYSIGVTGTQNLGGGPVTYQQGGFVIYSGAVWDYVPPSSIFTSLTANTHLSVNQPTGAITISVDATPSLVNSTIVSRDANGSFAANVITATLSGAATSAGTAATVTNSVQTAITQVGTLSSLTVSGNASGGNLLTAGLISATGNITAAYHIGNGSQLTSLTGSNVTGVVANATYAVSANAATYAGTVTTAAQPNITSVGTLTSLSSSGNVTASYFLGNGSALTSITGANVTGVVANATYAVSSGSATTAGTVTTAAQPNITSVGTLSSVSVTGNATSGNVLTGGVVSATGNITGNYFIGNGSQLTGITSYGNANVNTLLAAWGSNTISTTGTITAGNITGGNVLTGGVISATGNITGGNLSVTNIAGTLTTAAQTNITSVGTLGALTVTANIAGGNITTSGQVSATGNITGGNVLTGGQVSATGNITTGANAIVAGYETVTGNITGGNVLTGGQVTATGNITGGNLVATNNLVVTGNIRYDQASNNATVTQLTNKATAVTCNGRTGQITTNNANLNKGAAVTFTVNNSFITSAKDVVILSLASGATVGYTLSVNAVNASGSFVITINNSDSTPSGSNAADTLVINFAVIKVS